MFTVSMYDNEGFGVNFLAKKLGKNTVENFPCQNPAHANYRFTAWEKVLQKNSHPSYICSYMQQISQ